MNVLTLVMHIGAVLKAGRDMESTIGDLLAKKNIKADIADELADVVDLIADSVIAVPGVEAGDLENAVRSVIDFLDAKKEATDAPAVIPPQAEIVLNPPAVIPPQAKIVLNPPALPASSVHDAPPAPAAASDVHKPAGS